MDKIATNIETELWYKIIDYLKKDNWIIKTGYNQFDKGIDFDLYEFQKDNETILCAWDNWFEGEIKCNEMIFSRLELDFKTEFTFGQPEHLNVDIVNKKDGLLDKY